MAPADSSEDEIPVHPPNRKTAPPPTAKSVSSDEEENITTTPMQQPRKTFNLDTAISEAIMANRRAASSLTRAISPIPEQESSAAQEVEGADPEEITQLDSSSSSSSPQPPPPPSSSTSTSTRKCTPCHLAKKSCPGGQPCARCISKNITSTCTEYIRQRKTPKSINRTPKLSTQSTPADSATTTPEIAVATVPDRSKLRCQKCITRKKGCDRERPCGRCREAGVGWEGCVPEEKKGK